VILILGLIDGALSTAQIVGIAEVTEEVTENVKRKKSTYFKYYLWIWLEVARPFAQTSITRTANISISDSKSYETRVLNTTPCLWVTEFKPVQPPDNHISFYSQMMLSAKHL
jgi:hypothetical protein